MSQANDKDLLAFVRGCVERMRNGIILSASQHNLPKREDIIIELAKIRGESAQTTMTILKSRQADPSLKLKYKLGKFNAE